MGQSQRPGFGPLAMVRARPAVDAPPMVSRSAIAAVAAPFGRDLDAALERIERTVAQARAGGAGLVVFPECALGGYIREDPAGPDLPPALHP